MFTGLVEATAAVASFVPTADGARLRVATPLAADLAIGDSIAVNGCCLTVVGQTVSLFEADVTPVTMAVTNLARPDLTVGDRVNLERPLRLGDRLGGHVVTGHVDAVAVVLDLRRLGDGDAMQVECALPASGRQLVVDKGAITVNGVSLTVTGLTPRGFTVALIPHTRSHTTLGQLTLGQRVNLEYDLMGKYALNRIPEEVPS
ncbi:MAG: riboflavin synthase [Thermaerobacter sp.]|nr:riboflavin synthase [Thermaerobacter sp.]